MNKIKVSIATNKDKKHLSAFFQHYGNKDIIKKRVECFLSHNFTVVAKDNSEIVGLLQWHIKEDPAAGVAEFEEVFVNKTHRGRGIGSLMVGYAINSVKAYFASIGVKPRKIYLFTGEDNAAARQLYEKHGFKAISKIGTLFDDKKTELFYILDFLTKQ
jgi:ribosomal protein S18 acetylase RimI-like enzyme